MQRQAPPIRIYKYFRDESHALALLSGFVHLSTLESCRGYEDERGDRGEARHHRFIEDASTDDQAVLAVVNATGQMHLGPGITLKNVTLGDAINDAYVICCTCVGEGSLHRDRFGKFGVEIADADSFGKLMHYSFTPIFHAWATMRGAVQYGRRDVRNLDPDPQAPMGFVKPHRFADEVEYRYLIAPPYRAPKLKPFGLTIPRAAELCRRMW